jgi:hypothetical protein
MSCRELDRPDPLVYIRRTTGGGVGGVIYAWDYYLMASLPTNDNVRYSMHENADGSAATPLHEINNNRYNDVVCKSTHVAYRIGGFSRSAPIAIGDAKNDVDKQKETTDNGCILMIVSSSNFYARLPECWPWSCRRWTAEGSGALVATGAKNKDGEELYKAVHKVIWYKEDEKGEKVQVDKHEYYRESNSKTDPATTWDKQEPISSKMPKITISIAAPSGDESTTVISLPVFKITKDTYSSDIGIASQEKNIKMSNVSMMEIGTPDVMFGARFETVKYKTASKKQNGEYDKLSDAILKNCNCADSTKQIKVGVEIFPVLCNGKCKLVIKFGFLCYDQIDGKPSAGRSTKRLISPFWSCRMNEIIYLTNEEVENRPIIASLFVGLDGTELKDKENLGIPITANDNDLYILTGQDYYQATVDNKLTQVPYNYADGPSIKIDYPKNQGESFGKTPTYLMADASCCSYCKTADKDGVITFSNNLYCNALDPECKGDPYGVYDDPCPVTK